MTLEEEEPRRNLALFSSLVAVFVLIAGVGAYFAFRGDSDKSSSSSSPAATTTPAKQSFVGRGTITAGVVGSDAFSPSTKICWIDTGKGMISRDSVVTITLNGRIVGTGPLGNGLWKTTVLGAECTYNPMIEVSETAPTGYRLVVNGVEGGIDLTYEQLHEGNFIFAYPPKF